MKGTLATFGSVWVSILLAGCSGTAPSIADHDHAGADEKAIHAAELAWASDWSSGNLDKVLSHYADDATVKIPGLPIMNGRDSNRLGLSTLLNDPGNLSGYATAERGLRHGLREACRRAVADKSPNIDSCHPA